MARLVLEIPVDEELRHSVKRLHKLRASFAEVMGTNMPEFQKEQIVNAANKEAMALASRIENALIRLERFL